MKTDINNRSDLETLIFSFYNRVKADQQISHFFRDVVPVNWENHLPVMVDFWDHVLFHSGSYRGNPLQKHRQVSLIEPIRKPDFTRWIQLWEQTVDDLYSGEMADTIKRKAGDIARLMQGKLELDTNGHHSLL